MFVVIIISTRGITVWTAIVHRGPNWSCDCNWSHAGLSAIAQCIWLRDTFEITGLLIDCAYCLTLHYIIEDLKIVHSYWIFDTWLIDFTGKCLSHYYLEVDISVNIFYNLKVEILKYSYSNEYLYPIVGCW